MARAVEAKTPATTTRFSRPKVPGIWDLRVIISKKKKKPSQGSLAQCSELCVLCIWDIFHVRVDVVVCRELHCSED